MKSGILRGWLAMLLGVSGVTFGMATELAPLDVPVCEKPPMLDGKLDDPLWQQALKIENLYQHNSATPAPETTIYLARDKAWLYIGAQCRNPHMEHVAQLIGERDGMVHKDDSLEIFIRPTSADDDPYYHFTLNFANVGKEQLCNKADMRKDLNWNPPWRTATQRQANGWMAEIAIPLYCLATDDLSGMSINIGRNFMKIELDSQGAKQGETRVHSMLRPDNKRSFHDFANFQAVAGIGGFKPEIPFAPQIAAATIAGVRQSNGKNFYDLKLTLESATPVAGKARLKIIENFGAGEVETLAQTVDLKGTAELTLNVPAGDLRERKVMVVLADPADGNLLAARTIDDTSALSVIRQAFVGRSYYTSEDVADIRVELGLPAEMLARAELTLEVGGKKAVELTGLKPLMTPGVPVAALAMGNNPVNLRVMLDGKELAAKTLNVIRLEPRPGYEVQADFIKGVVLKDKKPIFPVGIYGFPYARNDGFRYLVEDIGLNTLVKGKIGTNIPAVMQQVEKYTNLNVITWTSPQPVPIGMKKGTRKLPPVTLSLAKRLVIQKKRYKELEPGIIAETKLFRNYKNFIGYWNVDEPNLVNPDERIAMAEWYWDTVYAIDPYRPQFLLYSKHIPPGDNWTRWGEILGYDVYPHPHVGGFYSKPGLATAFYAYELRERCRRDSKIMWFVPLSSMLVDLARTPIGMSKAHMLCQAYTAIIYGARGLIYYALFNVVGEDAWDALRTISAQVTEMTPALVNGDIAQNIQYTPDNFRPRERKFPLVNAAVFKYPDGDYLLMAVNITPFAVDTRFQVKGIKNGVRLFDADVKTDGWLSKLFGRGGGLALDDGIFTDKIEPYGVRAYRLKLADSPAPVEVALDMTAMEDEQAPAVDIPGIVRQVMLGKNHMPNPCFARQCNQGIPDFYRPHFYMDPFWGQKQSGWYMDDTVLWNGHPSLLMRGRPFVEGNFVTGRMLASFYPPVSDQPMKLTFSFYARSENPKASLRIRIQGVYPAPSQCQSMPPVTIRKLSADWQRHHFTFELTPGAGSNMGAREFLIMPSGGAGIWINGLQMEAGETPTEFQDDSVLVKKK